MLTIIAWLIFIPAAVWNVIFFSLAFTETLTKGIAVWNRHDNWLHAIASLALLLAPGIYLFGLY